MTDEVVAEQPQDADASSESKPDNATEAEAEVVEQAESQESEAESSPAVEEDDDKKTDPFNKRIGKLTANWRESQRANAELQQEVTELRKQLSEMPDEEPLKTLEDFEYDQSKFMSYLASETTSRAEKAAERVAQGFQAKAAAETTEEAFRRREMDFAKTVPDYYDAVYGEVDGQRNWAATDVMARELKSSDIGHQMTYYLAKNPDIALEIFNLDERSAIRRMAILEETLKSEKAKATKKAVSKAPPPPPSIKGSDAGIEKDPAKMTDREFANWRRKQIANR